MRTFKTLLAVAALSAPLAAQGGSLLSETFDYGTTGNWPPTGWTAQDAGTAPYVWNEASLAVLSLGTMTFDAAAHEYSVGVQCESYLLTPQLDFSGAAAPSVEFDFDLYWILYMSHTGSIGGNLANGEQHVRVSTDGGLTFSNPVWTFDGLADGLYPDEVADLSAYAGNSSVNVVFHYSGDFAHDAGIDNVDVTDGGTAGPSISVSAGAPGGPMTFDFAGFTANGQIAIVYGPAGSLTLTSGPCAGITLGVLPINFPPTSGLIILVADGSGNAQLTQNVPGGAAGLSVQAADVATCGLTGVIVL